MFLFFFFFNDTATTEIYTLSLHDALPICRHERFRCLHFVRAVGNHCQHGLVRSEEHTSELQSLAYLVCRLLLEKKKKKYKISLYLDDYYHSVRMIYSYSVSVRAHHLFPPP